MIELKQTGKGKLYNYSVYLNGKLLSEKGYYEELEKIIMVDDLPTLDIKKIAGIKTEDFPDGLWLTFCQEQSKSHPYCYFDVIRRGKKITLSIDGDLDLNSHRYNWLFWNPEKLITEMCRLAKAAGYKTTRYSDPYSIAIDFDFKTGGNIGSMFNTAMERVLKIQLQAEKNLLKLAAERVGK